MPAKALVIYIRFLGSQSVFHGQRDNNEPEWPPSPSRVFQALIDAAASRQRGHKIEETVYEMLAWMERLNVSEILAPTFSVGTQYRIAVPNNDLDVWAGSVSKGNVPKKQPNELKTMKQVHPVRISGDTVHYLYSLPDGPCPHLETLKAAARSITHLGWGIDMVAADADVISVEDAAKLPGQRWCLSTAGGTPLRVPETGTLDDLLRKHTAFLNRVSDEGFKPVPPLTVFRTVRYRRTTDVVAPRVAAFQLLKLDASGYRAFDSVRKTMIVAGMLRHTATEAGWRPLGFSSRDAAQFLHGHGEARGAEHAPVAGTRLAYLPLPSIEFRGPERGTVVGSVRRALLMVVGHDTQQPTLSDERLQHVARLLSATTLQLEQNSQPQALLSRLPTTDKMVRHYTDASTVWSTVTPVILPGYDDPRGYRARLKNAADKRQAPLAAQEQRDLLDKLDHRIDFLLRKAIRQAGFSDELARHAEIEWRGGGFRPGTALATYYAVPHPLRRYRRLHVRITWRDSLGQPLPVPGPICLGAGRFCGLGLFATENS